MMLPGAAETLYIVCAKRSQNYLVNLEKSH